MKLLKKITAILFFVFMATLETSRVSSGVGLPVGGRVTMYNPACTVGLYINIATVVPGMGAGTWMYNGMAMTYLYGPPLPGGQTLGMATGYVPCLTYCTIGVCPAGIGGPHIYMIGTGF